MTKITKRATRRKVSPLRSLTVVRRNLAAGARGKPAPRKVGGVRRRIRQFAVTHYPRPHLTNFALDIGVNRNQLSRYDDDALPSGPIILRMALAGMNVHWMLTDVGEMDAPREAA